jgi:hypothetical protein
MGYVPHIGKKYLEEQVVVCIVARGFWLFLPLLLVISDPASAYYLGWSCPLLGPKSFRDMVIPIRIMLISSFKFRGSGPSLALRGILCNPVEHRMRQTPLHFFIGFPVCRKKIVCP